MAEKAELTQKEEKISHRTGARGQLKIPDSRGRGRNDQEQKLWR